MHTSGISGGEVKENTKSGLSRQAINSARTAQLKKDDFSCDLKGLLEKRSHHLLYNENDTILIFGAPWAIDFMAATPLIFADGTFSCVTCGFSQLYIFHAVVKNDVSLPMLFCLIKGKTEQIYSRLIRAVERIANTKEKSVFDREVRLVCDFELSFVKSVTQLFPKVKVRCCFFHFVKNVRKNMTSVMRRIAKQSGKTSHDFRLAQKTKRRFMMLPLVPRVSYGGAHHIHLIQVAFGKCPRQNRI